MISADRPKLLELLLCPPFYHWFDILFSEHIECMAASPQLALYTWYHQHKKKDLGFGQKDWLYFFQEQVKDDKKNSSTNTFTKICEGIVNDECVTRESQVEEKNKGNLDKLKQLQQQQNEDCADAVNLHLSTKFQEEEQDEYWSQSSSHSQKIEGAQHPSGEEPVTPHTSQLNTTLNSPILLLPQGNNISVEESHTLPLCSPALTLCDVFSPAKRDSSPRDTIMESLAINLDGSEVSWSSALATPTSTSHSHTVDCTSPSTLERQTLHPRQGLRENVLARSLFSPRTCGAAGSSSSGELSPGLGIINCFSPVSRFSCRSMSSTNQKRPCHDERTKPDWLEAGTQGFRISVNCEKNVLHGKNILVNPEENQQRSGIRPFLCDEEYSHSPQTKPMQDCIVVRPDQTSTPVQPRSVKARHLVLNEQSPKPIDFLEPIPFEQEIKEEGTQETNLGLYKKGVTEYSCDSAEDPFDIMCSPVCKVKQRKKSIIGKIKSTLETSELKLNEKVKLIDSVKSTDEKIKKEPVLIEVEDSLSEMFSGCPDKNMPIEGVNISGENSLCKDGSLLSSLSNEKIEAVKNADPKVKVLNEEHTIDVNCQTDIRHQTEHSIKRSDQHSTTPPFGMFVAELSVNPKRINLSDSINAEKQCIEMTSKDKEKCISCSKQERTNIEMPSFFKKSKLAKRFVYPTNLGEGYEELNVSYTETIGDDETRKKTEAPGTNGVTRNIPNIGLASDISNKTVESESKGVICSTPVNKREDEKCIEVVPVSKRTICNTHAGRDESWLDGEIPNGKRTSCNIPATLPKAKEEVDFLAKRQKKFLSLSNLENSDTLEISSNSSFEPLQHDGCEQSAKSSEMKKRPIDTKERTSTDNQHCIHRVVPVASVTPFERESTKEITVNSSLQTYNVDIKFQENMQNISITPSRNMKMSSVRTQVDLASITQPALPEQCPVDLSELKVHEHKPVEGLTIQGNKGQVKHAVSISLNNQLVSDTFSDIDFSDSDFDISLPLEEGSAMDNNKNLKPDKDSDVFTKVACRKGGFDEDYFNWSNSVRDPGFTGFMTGSGKQVKVSDKALEEARKFLEEQTCEEHNLGLQQVSNGKPVNMDYSDIPQVKREKNKLTSLHMAAGSNFCTLSEMGSFTILNGLPNDVGNEGTSKFGQNTHNKNILEVNSNCTYEKAQGVLAEETSRQNTSEDMKNTFTHGDGEMSKGSVVQDSCYDTSRKTSVYGTTETQQLKAKNTGRGFQKFAKSEEAEVKASMVFESAYLLCKESNSTGEAKLMENTETTIEHKASAFQGFSTAAGSQIKISKEALRKAQIFWEEEKCEKADMSIQTHENETSRLHEYNSLSKVQTVRLRSAIPAELKTTIGTLTLKSQQCIPSRRLKTTMYSSNDCNLSNQPKHDLEKLSKSGLPSSHTDKSICSSTYVLGHQSGSLVASQHITNEANKKGISLHTLHSEPFSFKKNSKSISNAENNTLLEMDVGFHTIKKKAFVKEASISKAAHQKETTSSEKVRPLQQQNIIWDPEVLEEIGTGFHTAKEEKISVNKSSVTQACLLWKETDGSEVKTLDQEVAQELESTHFNVEISDKLISKPDGMFLGSMKVAPDLHCLPKKDVDSNISSTNTLPVRKTEEKEFAAFSNQGTMSSIDVEISGKRNEYDETSTKLQLRNADTFTVLNTDTSTASEKNVVQNLNLFIKPRKLFEDEMHFKSVMNCQTPLSVSQNDIDFFSDGKSNIHKNKIDNTKQVKVSSKSLQQAKQLSQQCIISKNCPSFETEKDLNNTCKRQAAAVESFVVTVDQNTGNTDECVEVICGSPILGSQRSNKEKDINNMCLLTASRSLKNDSVNTQEISDISDVTEAFLKDSEDTTKKLSSQRKRPLSLDENKEKDSLTSHKKMKGNMTCSQPENLQGCGARETSRILAREKLKELIQLKEKQGVQPIPGSLYKLRTERKQDRIKLHSYGNLKLYNRKKRKVETVTFSNALHYRFEVQDSRCDSIKCDDGCVLLLGPDDCVGIEEVELGFLAMPGVHPGLIPPSWIHNHYKLIVWQLAALERRIFDCQVLTVENVVARLKYRYDREIDRAERSILRKITEQDDVPQKTMVLCVTSVKLGLEADARDVKSRTVDTRLLPMLELTDGWYIIGAVVDKAMCQLIKNKRVEVGTKLVLHGSELVGTTCPCHPLKASPTLCLRLHTNMTRRARWWTRLGLLPQNGPLPSFLEATHCDGGLVGQVNVMVTRLYPLYYERSQDGLGVFMGEKAYLKKLFETERQKELLVEQITAEVEKELHHEERKEGLKTEKHIMTPEEIRGLTLGQEISQLLDEAADPSSLEELLTPHQKQLARTWCEKNTEETRQRLHTEVMNRFAKRQKHFEAIPLLKVRIVDGERDGALVTVWRPSMELRENISEGSFFTIRYLMADGFRSVAMRTV
ncbi:uncharacterized protein LOC135104258 isoform X3 [Scylla paramamosain]|uniref:uncharacterized protein LOC135104258 isoform X3 n=1 Tax=Scylla paramamosain TaxID=85552 RepID=UPI003083E1E0